MYHIVEEKIKESVENGEFDDLIGKGKPLNLKEDLQGLSPEIRRAYKILKNAGYIPEQQDIKKDKLTFRDLYTYAAGKKYEQPYRQQNDFESLIKERNLKKTPSYRQYAKKIYQKLFF
ncbi:DnaJ family domain-containing protein [Oceanobacillus salinisoli]|uniref:DnaJ family domain-containing protein n=1 Tax=Oceanobacillus salinisoli TaxID=2678611 RepID=UPI0012E26C76|nr:DUF1992 domain-containing protein [Oceanobacillus salinisoli]